MKHYNGAEIRFRRTVEPHGDLDGRRFDSGLLHHIEDETMFNINTLRPKSDTDSLLDRIVEWQQSTRSVGLQCLLRDVRAEIIQNQVVIEYKNDKLSALRKRALRMFHTVEEMKRRFGK